MYCRVSTATIVTRTNHNVKVSFLFNKTNRRTNSQIYFCRETLHVSGISSAHHQVFSTVNSALVCVMQVLITAFKHGHPGRA